MNELIWKEMSKASAAKRKKIVTEVFLANTPLIGIAVQRFSNKEGVRRKHLAKDLYQAASLGLVNAINTWRPAKQGPSSFSHWAFVHMRQEMQVAWLESKVVSVPRDVMFANVRPGVPEAELNRREKLHAHVADWNYVPYVDGEQPSGRCTQPTEEEDIDRRRDAGYLQDFLATLSKTNQRAFWGAERPDLVEKAKAYVEYRRATR